MHRQIESYKQAIPSLFTYNSLVVISDVRAGSLSAGFSRYMAWKTADGKAEASKLVSPPDMQLLATDTVLKQAEMIAEELLRD